jgi:twitching motility protein PilT
MDQLNEYLQELISTSSYALHLEPNTNPYIVSANGNTDVANAPLLGSQISLMVFPLIPAEIKQDLPNQPEIQFVHPSNLGEFDFTVQKSPAGFNVTIKPLTTNGMPREKVELPSSDTPAITEEMMDQMTADLENNPVYNDLQAGQPEFNADALPNVDSSNGFQKTETSGFNEIKVEDLAPAQMYQPPVEETDSEPKHVEAEKVIKMPVVDRRADERLANNADFKNRMEALFYKMSEFGASDLHLSVDMPPMVRKDGKIQSIECDEEVLTTDTMKGLIMSIMPERNRDEFAERKDSDFAYEIPGLARFRCNIFMDRKGMGGVFRIIPTKMTTAEDLGLPASILGMCELNKGLVVVTGPTGSGKSTTLCAMVNHINTQREDHIITIEDPIEFVHENQKCLVNQREVHNHTSSFKDALRAALREDPDIILVGEMRDLETIAIAIETAETGHLVFGTLHTTTAPSTVDRIIDQFPADRQQQIRVMLSESLKGVVAQTLLPKIGGGRVAALEILIITPAISNLIREGKTFQIASAMQTGKSHGMVLLNDSLYDLVEKKIVEPRDAYLKAVDKTSFETMLKRGGFKI